MRDKYTTYLKNMFCLIFVSHKWDFSTCVVCRAPKNTSNSTKPKIIVTSWKKSDKTFKVSFGKQWRFSIFFSKEKNQFVFFNFLSQNEIFDEFVVYFWRSTGARANNMDILLNPISLQYSELSVAFVDKVYLKNWAF